MTLRIIYKCCGIYKSWMSESRPETLQLNDMYKKTTGRNSCHVIPNLHSAFLKSRAYGLMAPVMSELYLQPETSLTLLHYGPRYTLLVFQGLINVF